MALSERTSKRTCRMGRVYDISKSNFFRLVLMFIYFMVFSLVNIVGFHLEVNANSCGHVRKLKTKRI